MNCKINIDKFICFLIENKSDTRQLLEVCLKSQGLKYKDGEIVEIDNPPLTEEQKTDNEKGVKKDDDIYMYGRGINGETIYLTHGDVRQIFGELLEHPEKKEIYITHKDKPQTIKFNESEEIDSVWPKEVVDELLEETQKNTPKVKDGLKKFFSNVFPTIYDIDIEKMVEEYKEDESKVLLPLGFSKGNIEHLSIAYKNGIEDMLKLIKEGGE